MAGDYTVPRLDGTLPEIRSPSTICVLMNRRRRKRQLVAQPWSVAPLERRILLAADAGSSLPAPSGESPQPAEFASATAPTQPSHLVFVDPRVDELDSLLEGIGESLEIVLLDTERSGTEQISEVLKSKRSVQSLHLLSHGSSGRLALGNETLDEASLARHQHQLRGWSQSLTADADILLYGCDVGEGAKGTRFVHRLAELTGADVAASIDRTGAANRGGDWDLERAVGEIQTPLAISDAAQRRYDATLPISIRAAGQRGEEQMLLRIDGAVVATYDNVGGDAANGLFETFVYDVDGITADQVRIEFTNDLYDESAGVDRNLRVDNITIDGTTYETEAPTVYSTGTWLPADGIVAGFRESEYLHSTGYFQFADPPTGTGSTLAIQARGNVGEETMELQIDGVTVETWQNVATQAGVYIYRSNEVVTADRVRVAFTNDLFDEANGIDRNLIVDSLSIDGEVFQTESPDVYSTGTWRAEDGLVAGFRQSETLHSNGYFQYTQSGNGSGSLIAIEASGNEGSETMELLIDAVSVAAWQNVSTSGGLFTYQAAETIAPDRIRVGFTNDLFDEPAGIDRNLNVDKIFVDGQPFETEAPSVFSTGTWLPEDGVVPGFRQNETLHTTGYFQYAALVGPEPEPGSIGLTLETLTIDEDLGVLNVVVFRADGTDGTVTVDYSTVEGTASEGADYEAISGTLTFAEGVTGQQLSIPILDDRAVESEETFAIVLSNPGGGATLGGITSQQITIADNDDPIVGVIFADSFESTSNWTTNPFGTDTASTGMWEIGSPQQTTNSGQIIQFGSGQSGPGALVTGLAAGSSVGTFDVDSGITSVLSPVIDLPSGAEVQLRFEYNFAYLSNASNDDLFHVAIVSEGVETEIYEDHAHESLQAANWQLVSTDISQFAGQSIQILFEAGDLAGGSLIEAAVDDVVVEVLPNLPGTFNVSNTSVNLDESAGTATVTISRSVGRQGEVTVDYATIAGSAGEADFVPTAGTLVFADGQSEQTVTIEITDDSVVEALETFQLEISNPTGGAVLGSETLASITIADDDSTVADYLPDLTPIASTLTEALSIDTSEIPGRTLLRFSTEVANAGDGPLEIWGGSASGDVQQVFQRIYQADGGSRDALAGEFVYHAGHGHIHFEGFATYDLKIVDGNGEIVASGGKTSFCLINIRQPLPDATAAAGQVHGRGGNSCGQIQGISVGYSDVYSASLDDQWIDVTNVADGTYWLEITTDPENNIQETDESNNSARVQITLANGNVSF